MRIRSKQGWRNVDVVHVAGNFAVTCVFSQESAPQFGYTVTHIPSGYQISLDPEMQMGWLHPMVRYCQALDAANVNIHIKKLGGSWQISDQGRALVQKIRAEMGVNHDNA